MRRRAKLDYWQNDDGSWSSHFVVIVPGVPDWGVSSTGFADPEDVWAWSRRCFDLAMESVGSRA